MDSERREVDKAVEHAERKVDEGLKQVRRVFVAVHGIGDQFWYETIQLVAYRLGKFFDVPAPIPLGSFHSENVEEAGFLFLKHPPYPERFQDVGLSEIYWANIPREVQEEGHTLEESKKWAASLVGRLRMRAKEDGKAPGARGYEMLEQVIGEMIEGVAILDRLLFLVGKVSTFKFRLKDLLDSFLGDVQVVTDFEVERAKLMDRFRSVMDRIREANPKIEIYLVAHSEGTVVAFLALLKAFKGYVPGGDGRAEQFGWVDQVKGLMTIGSPIEEHLLLWPELWDEFEVARQGPGFQGWHRGGERIKWRNYLDNGDPIAYRLGGPPSRQATTSEWIKANGWGEVFEFEKFDEDDPGRHEFVFTRYPFPGKAHVDYWEDKDVFGHFLETVVEGKSTGPYSKPPKSRPWVSIFSRVVPYAIPAVLLIVGVYLLFQSVRGYLAPEAAKQDKLQFVVSNVLGISSLLGGITLMSRVPRLSRSRWARLFVTVLFVLSGVSYYRLVTPRIRAWIGGRIGTFIFWEIPRAVGLPGWRGIADHHEAFVATVIVVLLLVALVAYLSLRYPRLGAKTLIVPGAVAVATVIGFGIAHSWDRPAVERGDLWPVLLSGVAFLYLWWLAVVLFDLIYVWHHYIRGSVRGATAADRLRAMVKDPTTDR